LQQKSLTRTVVNSNQPNSNKRLFILAQSLLVHSSAYFENLKEPSNSQNSQNNQYNQYDQYNQPSNSQNSQNNQYNQSSKQSK
jgi:acetoin utilization deacetylase AcuC-like enzyme